MHPQDFRSIVDHLYDAYCTLHEEIHRLRKENKTLSDELSKCRNLNTTLSAKLCNLNSARILKMGADWLFDGDFLLAMSLAKRVKFNSPICNARISAGGRIAFTCNNKIFLTANRKTFLVEDKMRAFDMRVMRHDLVDLERRIFDFHGERLVVYDEGSVKLVGEDETVWSHRMDGVVHICTDGDLIYVGTEDGVIRVLEHDGTEVEGIETGGSLDTFQVRDGQILVRSGGSIRLHPGTQQIDTRQVLASEFDGKTVYYGGGNGTVGMAGVSGEGLQPYDTLSYKSTVLSLLRHNNFLFVATEDRTVSVVDLETKKQMRIVLMDNVVDMSGNKDTVCFVDNNGGLRAWEIKS